MHTKGLHITAYLLSLTFGVLTLMFPAPSIAGAIGMGLTYAYGSIITVGSVGVLFGIIMPSFKVELSFLWLVAGGYAMYSTSLWTLAAIKYTDYLRGVNQTPDGLVVPYGPAIVSLIVALAMISKIVRLRRDVRHLVKVIDNDRLD